MGCHESRHSMSSRNAFFKAIETAAKNFNEATKG